MDDIDQELERLSELLEALPMENNPMSLGELDGYIVGVLACPVMIPPSDWLPHVWGETGSAGFPDLDTAEETTQAVLAHYNSIAAEMRETLWLEPIYEVEPDTDDIIWGPWVDGFKRAMQLNAESWERLLETGDEETRTAMIFLMALSDIYEGTSKFSDEEIAQIDAEAPDMIPNCVATILSQSRPDLAHLS